MGADSGGGLGAAGGGLGAAGGGVLADEAGEDERGFGDGACVRPLDGDGVLLACTAGVCVAVTGAEFGASVIVGSTVVVITRGAGSGLLARACPMSA